MRQLVLQDKVFAILNGLGTPTHTGVLDFLKDDRGAGPVRGLRRDAAGTSPSKYPGTFACSRLHDRGQDPRHYIKTNFAGKKVCFFGQDDDFGRDGLAGLEKGLGADR